MRRLVEGLGFSRLAEMVGNGVSGNLEGPGLKPVAGSQRSEACLDA